GDLAHTGGGGRDVPRRTGFGGLPDSSAPARTAPARRALDDDLGLRPSRELRRPALRRRTGRFPAPAALGAGRVRGRAGAPARYSGLARGARPGARASRPPG